MNGKNYHIYIYYTWVSHISHVIPQRFRSELDFWIPPNLFSEAPSFHLALIGMAMPSPRKNGENIDLFLVCFTKYITGLKHQNNYITGQYKHKTSMVRIAIPKY